MKELTQIDERRLDEECIRQPELAYDVYAKQAAARRELDDAKAAVGLAEADVAKSVREAPKAYGLEKTTDKAVADVVASSTEVRDAKETVREKLYQRDMLDAAVAAVEHRKRMLELLVSLHGQNYFADVKIDRKANDAEQATPRTPRRSRERRS